MLMSGQALVPLQASFDGSGQWVCDLDDSPKVCRRIQRQSRVNTAMAFLAFLGTIALLVMSILERRKMHRRSPSTAA